MKTLLVLLGLAVVISARRDFTKNRESMYRYGNPYTFHSPHAKTVKCIHTCPNDDSCDQCCQNLGYSTGLCYGAGPAACQCNPVRNEFLEDRESVYRDRNLYRVSSKYEKTPQCIGLCPNDDSCDQCCQNIGYNYGLCSGTGSTACQCAPRRRKTIAQWERQPRYGVPSRSFNIHARTPQCDNICPNDDVCDQCCQNLGYNYGLCKGAGPNACECAPVSKTAECDDTCPNDDSCDYCCQVIGYGYGICQGTGPNACQCRAGRRETINKWERLPKYFISSRSFNKYPRTPQCDNICPNDDVCDQCCQNLGYDYGLCKGAGPNACECASAKTKVSSSCNTAEWDRCNRYCERDGCAPDSCDCTSSDGTEHCSCKGKQNDRPAYICGLPKDPGPCYGNFPRWYYNNQQQQCQQFIYGGCNGNENNFKTLDECAARCERPRKSNRGNNKDWETMLRYKNITRVKPVSERTAGCDNTCPNDDLCDQCCQNIGYAYGICNGTGPTACACAGGRASDGSSCDQYEQDRCNAICQDKGCAPGTCQCTSSGGNLNCNC